MKTEQELTARKMAIDAYTVLSSSFVDAHLLGRKILAQAINIHPGAVAELDQEMEQQGEDWADTVVYPDRMELFDRVTRKIRGGLT